jgi:hypothetical protein
MSTNLITSASECSISLERKKHSCLLLSQHRFHASKKSIAFYAWRSRILLQYCTAVSEVDSVDSDEVTPSYSISASPLPAVHAGLPEQDAVCLRAAFDIDTSKRMHFGTVLGTCVSCEQVNRFLDCGFRKSIPETWKWK